MIVYILQSVLFQEGPNNYCKTLVLGFALSFNCCYSSLMEGNTKLTLREKPNHETVHCKQVWNYPDNVSL